MRQLIVTALVFLAGCGPVTWTPDLLKTEHGAVDSTYASANPPRAVANCIARNSIYAGFGMVPITVETPTGGMEVAFIAGGAYAVHFSFIEPSKSGSVITMRSSLIDAIRAHREAEMLKGC